MTTLRLLALVAAVAALLAACGDGDDTPVTGTDVPPGSGEGRTEVHVVVDGGEFDRLSYTVTCGPDGATVSPEVTGVDAARGCPNLTDPATVRLLVDGPPEDRLCTEIYGGPQEATITGTLAGEPVDARVTRADGCQIDTWDEVLAGVLPPTEGVQAEG